jgi:hypothetical protein
MDPIRADKPYQTIAIEDIGAFAALAFEGSVATLQECFDNMDRIWSSHPQSAVFSSGGNLNRK